MYWRRIRLAKRLKSFKRLRLIRPSFVAGVGMNFNTLDNRLICSSNSCLSDRFLIRCLRDSALIRDQIPTNCCVFSFKKGPLISLY